MSYDIWLRAWELANMEKQYISYWLSICCNKEARWLFRGIAGKAVGVKSQGVGQEHRKKVDRGSKHWAHFAAFCILAALQGYECTYCRVQWCNFPVWASAG